MFYMGVKLGLSLRGKTRDCVLRTQYRGKYLDLRKRKFSGEMGKLHNEESYNIYSSCNVGRD
jgi:hypothetical protein